MREKTRRGRLNEYGNEYGKYAACVLSGFVLYGLSEAVGEIGDPVRDGVLARNEYGGGDRQYELLVEGLENGEEQVKVTVPERKMSDAEVQRELPGIMEYLKGEILGGNSSLSKVQSDLNLTRTLVKYGLSVEWESGDPETVSDMGLIGSEMPESGKTVTLRAGLMNGSSVTWVEIPVTVFPETETLGETFSAFLGKLAEKDLETGQVVLPETFDGRTLHYRSADGCGNGGLIFLGIAAALCLFVNPDMQRLVQVTKECMEIGIAAAQPWKQLGDVGAAIQEHAEKNGFSVVRDLCGHGVGMQFHEEPDVEHFGRRGTGMMIVPGMTFTIEPMINMGTYEVFIDDADGWTVCTDDGLPSAQWENMILITENGNEILTY